MLKVVIVIPIHKADLNEFEKVSFIRCLEVLPKYEISLLTHNECNIEYYIDLLRKFSVIYSINIFDKIYFESTETYNHLMVSQKFYTSYIDYNYILIYQLDAYVFYDKLMYWCSLNYDYIGAPWLGVKWVNRREIFKKIPLFMRIALVRKILGFSGIKVGNGGLSLRKVQSHLEFSKKYSMDFPILGFNEDIFWGIYITTKEKSFRIPNAQKALEFSIESHPSKYLNYLHGNLPFGCHAWQKNELNIWEEHIDYFNK